MSLFTTGSVADILDHFERSLDRTRNHYTWVTQDKEPVDVVKTTDTGYEIYLDLPGVKQEDISITIDDERLFVTAKRTRGREETVEYKYTCYYGELGEATSELENGVLYIFIPKKKSKSKQIEVKAK